MKTRLAVFAWLPALLIAGCANFGAVSEFAQETTRVSGVARAELTQLDTLCRDQAELTIVVNDIADEGPLQACDVYKASQGRLAAVTLDVLDDYARALAALADDKSFELTTDINSVGKRVAGLQEQDGRKVLSRDQAVALTQIMQVLTEEATERARDRGVAHLAAQAPNLALAGRVLRSVFVADANAPVGRTSSPYANIIELTRDSFDTTRKQLGQARLRQAEPLRTLELLRAMRVRDGQLARRTGSGADAMPVVIAAAIDAWLAALDVFAEDALRPDRAELIRRIKALRAKTGAARNAFEKDHP